MIERSKATDIGCVVLICAFLGLTLWLHPRAFLPWIHISLGLGYLLWIVAGWLIEPIAYCVGAFWIVSALGTAMREHRR